MHWNYAAASQAYDEGSIPFTRSCRGPNRAVREVRKKPQIVTIEHVPSDQGGFEPAVAGRFARQVVQWQGAHGRHDLPWQKTRDPYAIWLSEIMLQQTQVGTVIPYYLRFLERF